MWIKCENKNLKKIYRAGFMEEPVEFSDNSKVQVTSKIGKKLIKRNDSIKAVKQNKSKETKKSKKSKKFKTKDTN